MERITSSRRKIAGLALAALLAACATTQDVEKAKATWNGAAYEDVLRAWGAPQRSTKTADGRDWHTWVTESYAQPGSSVNVGLGGFRMGGGGGSGVGVGVGVPVGEPSAPARCERTFVFDNGKVIEQYWAGPPSMCADLKKP